LKYGGAKPFDQALMNGLPEAVETDHGLTCQSLKTLVFRKYQLSGEMLYQEKSSKIHELRKQSSEEHPLIPIRDGVDRSRN